MTKKEVIFFSTVFFLLSVLTIDIVFFALTNKHITNFPGLQLRKAAIYSFTAQCRPEKPIANLEKAEDSALRKLAEYQSACRSLAANELMFYTDLPKDEETARKKAGEMARTLKEFKMYGITPIVMVEPINNWGIIDFNDFKSGAFDPRLKVYFRTLKENGITSKEIGKWVLFPAANLPYWGNTNIKPGDYGLMINRYFTIFKQYFPDGQASILLNSSTYGQADFKWSDEEYLSLSEYAANIQKGLLDSFGLQGFPWSPPATAPGPGVFDASHYLNSNLAAEAADILGVKQVWLDTGTFSNKYTLDEFNLVIMSPAKRKDILENIAVEAERLKRRGFQVSINLFALDQSQEAEATDWSYWPQNEVFNSKHTPVFSEFAAELNKSDINLSIYDKANGY